jgi:hypothetical protein
MLNQLVDGGQRQQPPCHRDVIMTSMTPPCAEVRATALAPVGNPMVGTYVSK